MIEYEKDPLTQTIIGCCYEVHNQLGSGFPGENIWNGIKIKLQQAGLNLHRRKRIQCCI